MKKTRIISDPEECRRTWERIVPVENLSDLWEVRNCFHRHYDHRLHFLVCENGQGVDGFLPLSWNQETNSFLYFPGETWSGKTWLEQNRLIARDGSTLNTMLRTLKGKYYLRYLRPNEGVKRSTRQIDEISYTFEPPRYEFDFDNYLHEFSGKSVKRLKKELAHFEEQGVEYRYDRLEDFELLIKMNISRYGPGSYFSDKRFRASFNDLVSLLDERGWLRITTVIIGGEVAAIDMGAVYNGTYTLLAGGTNPAFPGIAKLINLHHMRWACANEIERVDFLCGDFNWKTLFHLSASPLYVVENETVKQRRTAQPDLHQIQLELSDPSAQVHSYA